MSKNLEEKAMEITIDGAKRKIENFDGQVKYVLGESRVAGVIPNCEAIFQKVLRITLTNKEEERRFTFRGECPIQNGDYVTVGLFELISGTNAVYIAKYDPYGTENHHLYQRIDYMNGFNPSEEEREKIVLG